MTVNVYYSTDASAPTINVGGIGLGAILLACLVNGYGSRAAAGWTNASLTGTGANQFVFKQGTGSNGFYIQVDDSATAGSNTSVKATMFETMSAYNTGTNATPSALQLSGGVFWQRGSGATTGSPQRWFVIATAKTFYFWLEGDSNNGASALGTCGGFGDIDSFRSGDAYGTILMGYSSTSTPSSGMGFIAGGGTNLGGHYMMRRWDQLSSGLQVGKHCDIGKSNIPLTGGLLGATGLAYPNPEEGGIYLSPIWVHENLINAQISVRGIIPGQWAMLHNITPGANAVVKSLDQWNGTGALAGKTFQFFIINGGVIVFEISNTWS